MLATCSSDHPFDRGKHIHKVCMAYNRSIHLINLPHTLFPYVWPTSKYYLLTLCMTKENMTRLNPIEETPDNSIFLSEKINGWQLHTSAERNSTIRKYMGSHVIKVPWCDYMPNLQLGEDYVSFTTHGLGHTR